MVLTLGLQSTLKDNSKQEPTEWSKNALEKQNQESEDLGEASGKNYTPPPKKNWKKTGKKPSFAACHFSISPPPPLSSSRLLILRQSELWTNLLPSLCRPTQAGDDPQDGTDCLSAAVHASVWHQPRQTSQCGPNSKSMHSFQKASM